MLERCVCKNDYRLYLCGNCHTWRFKLKDFDPILIFVITFISSFSSVIEVARGTTILVIYQFSFQRVTSAVVLILLSVFVESI